MPRHAATATKSTMIETIMPLPSRPIICAICSGGRPPSQKYSPPISAAKPAKKASTGRQNRLMRCQMATAISPAQNETKVPSSVGRKMSAALKPTSPCLSAMLWRMAITDVGISVMPAVLSTRNMIIGLLAVSFCGLISCNSRIAFRPSGVAALSRPSMLALKFMTMLPLAGWPAGISGKTRRKNGATSAAEQLDQPAPLADLHDPQPQAHHADQAERDVETGLGRIEQPVQHAREDVEVALQQLSHRRDKADEDEGDPDLIEHRRSGGKVEGLPV